VHFSFRLRIALNRPEVCNAIDLPTAKASEAAVSRAADDREVRAVLPHRQWQAVLGRR
jgi:enoyl-CoA hydratase/carnithine racemase